jgi:hypothetical protein
LYSIARITNNHIEDWIDFIRSCHPGLRDEISNLSKILPKMFTWGAPVFNLVIEQIPRDRLGEYQAHSMNDLVQFNNVPEEDRIQGEPDFDRDMSKWHGYGDLLTGIEW